MVEAAGTRTVWTDLPPGVREAVEALLGGRVVRALSQRGGFSPGTADRVVTDGGRRAFVKAVHPDLDDDSAAMHRREAQVVATLPDRLPAPALVGHVELDGWVALVLEDVDGRPPGGPWRPEDLDGVLAALQRVSDRPVSSTSAPLPAVAARLRPLFEGWARIAARPPDGLDPWAAEHLDALVALAGGAGDAVTGDRLVHGDLRADDVLVRDDGSVVLVDWAHAGLGCSWLDALTVLLDVRLHDGAGAHDVQALLATAVVGVAPRAVTAVLAGMAGCFVDAALGWVRERLGEPAGA